MKRMTMAKAMEKAISLADKKSKGTVTRVYPLEGSGNKQNGYDYILIGVDMDQIVEGWMRTDVYEVAVYCNEETGFKVEAEIKIVHLDM